MAGYQITEKEAESVSHILDYGDISISLSNDYYGFAREFDRHLKAGTLTAMQNSMAVLMNNYGYTEQEAGAIVKAEVLKAERTLLDKYHEWEHSEVPKSDTLRAYVILFIHAVGGSTFWQSQCPRYHVGVTTTAQDRAQMIADRSKQPLKLEGYPPPAGCFHGIKESDSSAGTNQTPNKLETASRQLAHMNGNGTLGAKQDILVPFQKAGANEICMAPYNYTKSLPGKNTLGKFIKSLLPWLSVPPSSVEILKDTATMLFNSTLMLDDIEDGSQLRRGQPAAYVKFGLSQTVNSSTYLLAKVAAVVHRRLQPKCMEIFADELETLALGQALDIHWTFAGKCPSPQEYLIMVDNKTGGYFRLLLRLMEVEAGSEPDPDLIHLITLLGSYYQIRDDYQNLASDEYTAKKGFCDDLSEGKFSFPIIHMLEHSSNAKKLSSLIFGRQGDLSDETKSYILSEMKDAGSLDYTLTVLSRLFDGIWKTIGVLEDKLGENQKIKCLVLFLKL